MNLTDQELQLCTDAWQNPVPKTMFALAIAQVQHAVCALMDGPLLPLVAIGALHPVIRACFYYRSEYLLEAELWP